MSVLEAQREFTNLFSIIERAKSLQNSFDFSALVFLGSPCGSRLLLGAMFGMADVKRTQESIDKCSAFLDTLFAPDVVFVPGRDEVRVSPKIAKLFAEARRIQPKLEKAEFASCVLKCLRATVNATNDHCQAKCL